MLFSKFIRKVARLLKYYKISVHGTLKLENGNWKFRFYLSRISTFQFPSFLSLKTGSTLRSDKFQAVIICN